MAKNQDSKPARWQVVITDSGPHARLMGANGQAVMVTEIYADIRDAQAAIRLARRAVLDTYDVVDERDEKTWIEPITLLDPRPSDG